MLKSRMLKIIPLPAFTDNYIWAIVYGNSCVVVDPGDSSPVFDFLESNNLDLECILITHHHFDHTGGMLALAKKYDCPVYGPRGDHIEGLTSKVSEGDEITIFNFKFKIFETPGHTLDHIAYFHSSDKGSYLFCGDTLFSGGCGRLFEGTAEDMFSSLNKFISLPDETLVFCAHEYTQSNLKFALSVNPNNLDLIKYSKKVDKLRSNSEITLPSNIGLEKKINPFFLLNDKEILKNSEQFISGKISNSVESLAAIRSMKDSF